MSTLEMCHTSRYFCFVSFFLALGFLSSSCDKQKVSAERAARLAAIDLQPIQPADIFRLVKAAPADFTLINFWASWCAPCLEEFPELLKFRADWKDKGVRLEFVSVDFESDLADVKGFLSEQKVNFTTYLKNSDDQSFIEAMDSQWSGALPTTFVLNKKGEVVYRFNGPVNEAILENKMKELLKKDAGAEGKNK